MEGNEGGRERGMRIDGNEEDVTEAWKKEERRKKEEDMKGIEISNNERVLHSVLSCLVLSCLALSWGIVVVTCKW